MFTINIYMGNLLCYKTKIMPIVLIKGKTITNELCSICLGNFDNNNFIMPCGHHFHSECILSWFNKKTDCPLCRQPFKWTRQENMKVTNKYKNGKIITNN